MRWLCAFAVMAGCGNQDARPAPDQPAPPIPAAEVKRGLDACRAYVASVCACADKVPAAKETCSLAAALPDAIEVGQRLAENPAAAREDAVQAAANIRKTVKRCIEQTAQLPALGC